MSLLSSLAGCEKQKEKLEKVGTENDQIAFRDIHEYTYDEKGRIKVDRATSYVYVAGVPYDSIIDETIFKYNAKGQLVSTVNLPDSNRTVKIYNELDSLIGDFSINEFGDTVSLDVTVYDHAKKVRTKHRSLSANPMKDLENAESLINNDTLLFVTDFIYEKGIHVKSLFRDKNDVIIEEAEHYYDGDRRAKTITYALLGDAKYIKETTYYETFPNGEPDFVSVSPQGDTIQVKKTIIRSDGKIIMDDDRRFGIQNILQFNAKGQLMTMFMIDLPNQDKTLTKYKYDDWGNEVEALGYRQSFDSTR